LIQIPRGTYRALKRGCSLQTLIQELEDSAFNGYCRIARGSGSITLVFEKGAIRLAGYDALEGDAALERILQSGLVTIDAALHDLNPVQLGLAMEFSPSSVVSTELEGISSDHWGSHGVSGNNCETFPDLMKTGLATEIPDHLTLAVHTTPHALPAEKPGAGSEVPGIQTIDDDESLLAQELDALDAMDIEIMAEKFRASYRLLMERLELEHLIDQDTGNDPP
jgi:hypothetical protein